MDISQVTIGLAFLSGLASFLSPCVFSLVPAYIGYLGGRAAGGEATESNRFIILSHGVAFVLGFSMVFITLGVKAPHSAACCLICDSSSKRWVGSL